MKQFNLKEWLKNTRRKIITRNKRSVRIICTDSPDKEYPIVGFVEGDLEPCTWNLYGSYNNELSNGSYDLFFDDEEEKPVSEFSKDEISQVSVQKLWEEFLKTLPPEERKRLEEDGIHIEAGAWVDELEEDFNPCLECPEPY